VIASIVDAVQAAPGVRLADWSADPDHHRMVVTFVGPPAAVADAALRAADAAIRAIDLTRHQGVHPRIGVIDVLPFVPLREISLAECAQIACDVGQALAERFHLPVFLYEASSVFSRSLPAIRKEAFRSFQPDYGPSSPHPTAGAVVVGARTPLIAYNVHLASDDIKIARQIARELRSSSALPGVRALGLRLPSRRLTQVSMNITCPEKVALWELFSFIAARARALGTEVVESEVIGAIPGPSAFELLADALQTSLKPGQVLLETWPTL
jgi:glutamate formiminotransferase